MEQPEVALLADGPPSPRPPSPILPSGDAGVNEGDSSSAGSIPPADAVSAQLINNITMLDYHSLGKTTTLIHNSAELGNADSVGIGSTSGQLPYFVTWNWPLIRKILFWGVLSGLLACVAAVVAMVAALPRTCNPDLPWYQGKLFYEIFPASFQDSNGDGIGDLRGLVTRVDYIKKLGVRAVRLNPIFVASNYPEQYNDVLSLTEIDKNMGSLKDFIVLLQTFHNRNMSLVLDLPVYPFVTQLEPSKSTNSIRNQNETEVNTINHWKPLASEKSITAAIKFWVSHNVDGFYLKGIENLVNDPHFSTSIREWKKIIGSERVLIVSNKTIETAVASGITNIMHSIDLVDVLLEVGNGTEFIKTQIDQMLGGVLYSKPGYPWIHWTIGSINSKRLSIKLPQDNTLSSILMNMMLPGTPSIFYGDEISLQEVSEPEEDFHESQNIHNLTPMVWPDDERQFTAGKVLPWITGGEPISGITPFWHIKSIRLLASIRPNASPIYLNSIYKDGKLLLNGQIRYKNDIVVVERWYPRKNSYVFVSNMGAETVVTDLSMWFYGGTAVVASNSSLLSKDIVFKTLTLAPAEVLIIKLEK